MVHLSPGLRMEFEGLLVLVLVATTAAAFIHLRHESHVDFGGHALDGMTGLKRTRLFEELTGKHIFGLQTV